MLYRYTMSQSKRVNVSRTRRTVGLAICIAASILSAQDLTETASKISLLQVASLEQNVASNPDDLKSRELLITYYTLKGDKTRRLEHSLWLARNHPEAVDECPDARIAERDSPLDSMASFELARAIWLRHAETRTTEPRVLMNAALFISQFDPNLSERLLLQGRELQPKNREWDVRLADLYGKGIFTDGRFRPQTPPSPERHAFAVRARLVLNATNNAWIAGLAGLRLAPQDVTILRTRSPENIELGEKLLRKAHDLDPRDPQWEIYLHDFESARRELTLPESPAPNLGDAPPGTLVRRIAPEYPESARRAGISGLVQLRILIGTTGRVIVVRPVDGPLELQAAAAAAVKQWLFKPYLLDGAPAETWKDVGINFP